MKTPTPISCAQVSAIRSAPSYYSSTCISDKLGKNGGIDSGGLIDTFVDQTTGIAQTQIQIGIPTTPWSESSTNVIFDPYASMGNSPLYLMATAMGQEYFNLDMQFMFGIGSKESFAGMKQVPGSALFIPTNAAGVAGTYHVESFTFATIVAGYPSFFPAYACAATYPNVTTALGTACMPSANDPLYFYMSQNSGSPLINNNSAELVNSVIGAGLNFYRLYDALVASTDLCFLKLLETGSDDEAAVKILPAGYNLGWNSTWLGALPPSAPILAAVDISPWTTMGNSNYRDEVLRTAHNLEAAATCPMAGGIYDPPILLSDLQTFFFGNGGSAAAQGSGGLMLHFNLSAVQRTALWNDVTCAFNALKGLAPGRAANEISFRYDFLTVLRVAKQYLTTTRPYPTQADFTSWVSGHSTGGSACGTAIDTTFPYINGVTPANNSNVCPDFTVNFTTTDETALDKVEWSLDPDWLAWNPATHGVGAAYSFVAPASDSHMPTSGPGKLWIRSTDACGNSTVRQLNFTVLCGTPTFTVTPTATRTRTPTNTPSATPSVTPSVTPSRTGTATPSVTPSLTGTPSSSATPSVSPSPSGTMTATSSATPSPTRSVTPTWSSTATASQTPTFTATITSPFTSTHTPTRTASPSNTPSATATSTRTETPPATATSTATPSATRTATPSFSVTLSYSASPTAPGTFTDTPTFSPTPTFSSTRTPSPTFSETPSSSATPSPSATRTVSPTFSATYSITLGPSPTDSPTFTATASPSATLTVTATFSSSASPSLTVTPPNTATASLTPTPYQSPTITLTFSASPTKAPFVQQDKLIKVQGIYPNPFSDRVRVYYTLRVDAEVAMDVFNVAGEPIQTVSQPGKAGVNELIWDGSSSQGGRCASGVYILHLKAEGVDRTRDGFWETAVISR